MNSSMRALLVASITATKSCLTRTATQTVPLGLSCWRHNATAASESGKPQEQVQAGEQKDQVDVTALQNQIKEKDEQIAQLQDLYRRSLAEQENLRQRTKKEIDEKAIFAIQKFSKDLLTTADNLELTLKNSPPEEVRKDNKPLGDLFTGVSLTHAELLKCFKRHGIEKYEPLGEKFDPNLHQALFTGPVPGREPGTVFEVPKTGYVLHGRVLRPADVCVVKG